MICRVATLVSREQATEDPAAEFECLNDGCSSALRCRVRVSSRSQMFFRPEEVDRRSERESKAVQPSSSRFPNHTITRFRGSPQ